MAVAIQRKGAAKQRIRAGMGGRKSAAHADIWRQPYSEKELQSSRFELACEDGREQHMRTYGGSHTAKRSCEAADLSWHVGTESPAHAGLY